MAINKLNSKIWSGIALSASVAGFWMGVQSNNPSGFIKFVGWFCGGSAITYAATRILDDKPYLKLQIQRFEREEETYGKNLNDAIEQRKAAEAALVDAQQRLSQIETELAEVSKAKALLEPQVIKLGADLMARDAKLQNLSQQWNQGLSAEVEKRLAPIREQYRLNKLEYGAIVAKNNENIFTKRYEKELSILRDELQEKITALETELAQKNQQLSEFAVSIKSWDEEIMPGTRAVFSETATQLQLQSQFLAQKLEHVQKENEELKAPKYFAGATSIDAAGNRIIDHFLAHEILLDAIEAIATPKGFKLRFKYDRTAAIIRITSDELGKIKAEQGLHGLSRESLEFVLDTSNYIMSVELATVAPSVQASQGAIALGQPVSVPEAVEAVASGSSTSEDAFRALGCFPASAFENVIRDKFVPRVRVVAGSTGGKSPLMELISVAIAKLNQAELWLLNPLPGSPKDWFSVPGLIQAGSDGELEEAQWLETAHKELSKRRENLGVKRQFIMVMADEVNALARRYENLGTVLKDFYQLSDHAQMGIITAGQGANVSGVSGGAKKNNAGKLMEEDFQNATQVFTSQAAKVWLTKNNKALLPNLAELEKLCTELNKAEGLSARPKPGSKVVDRNAYRVALVVSPASDEPFFIQIPPYSFYAGKLDGVSFPSGAAITAPYENQVALGLAANPVECPSCGSRNTKVNKTLKASVKRVCGDCNHYYNVPKSAADIA